MFIKYFSGTEEKKINFSNQWTAPILAHAISLENEVKVGVAVQYE